MSAHAHGAPASSAAATPPPPAADPGAPSWRLLATLAFAGALSGGLIVTVYQATLPRIEAYRAAQVEGAIREVLKSPARWDTLYLVDGALTRTPAGDPKRLERVYLGYDAAGNPVGAAINAGAPGFADVVSVLFGLDPATGTVTGMKVLGHKETPGLGDKIEKPPFPGRFEGAVTPLTGVKASTGADGEILMITGATISSRTVVKIINDATARWRPLLEAYAGGAK